MPARYDGTAMMRSTKIANKISVRDVPAVLLCLEYLSSFSIEAYLAVDDARDQILKGIFS